MNNLLNNMDPTHYLNTWMTQVQEGTKAMFKMANTLAEESDKQLAESMKVMNAGQEQFISARKNALKMTEETVERAQSMTHSWVNNATAMWRMK